MHDISIPLKCSILKSLGLRTPGKPSIFLGSNHKLGTPIDLRIRNLLEKGVADVSSCWLGKFNYNL